MERAVLEFKPAKDAKEKAELFKCSKWVLVCISRFKRPVMLARERVRWWRKVKNVKFVWERRSVQNKKLWKFL